MLVAGDGVGIAGELSPIADRASHTGQFLSVVPSCWGCLDPELTIVHSLTPNPLGPAVKPQKLQNICLLLEENW